ncbi:MAG: hypothetical protein WD059_08090 [Balneolaceae bacterium]
MSKEKIDELEQQLLPFLENNPYSKIDFHEDTPSIIKPWNDDSLVINIFESFEEDLIKYLNSVLLPQRFSGIYHLEEGKMEFIFVPIEKEDSLFEREFEFSFEGKEYKCSYKPATPQLKIIGAMFSLTGRETRTNYRNLASLNYYVNVLAKEVMEEEIDEKDKEFRELVPASFFIEGFDDFDENKMIDVSKHLNFLMSYYDRSSAVIIMHPEEATEETTFGQLELIRDKFPKKLQINKKDSILLDLVLTANEVETRLQFLYFYQILEYASFYFLDRQIKFEIGKILNTPDLLSNVKNYTGQILDILAQDRKEDEAKIVSIIDDVCNPKHIWGEIEQNKEFFCSETEFEGGFKLSPIISEKTSFEDFKAMWIPKLPHTIRKIRNALVHGRESRQGFHIVHSKSNDYLLQPYINIIKRIAEEIVMHF